MNPVQSLLFRFFAAAVILLAPVFAHADSTRLLRQPALSEQHLAFVFAGDLWLANRDGSSPRRLTSHPATESNPVFSPDGSQIAFMANYEGNQDVYVIATAGGQPKRLTWHPEADLPQGWSSDGSEVAFVSYREVDHGRSGALYHVSTSGGLPARQMDARIYRFSYAPDGRLAYLPHGSGYNGLFGGSAGWKGYRGGTVPEIYLMSPDREELTVIPGEAATNFNPLWLNGKVYFISDRDDRVYNIFAYDPASGSLNKITSETDWDVRAMAGHGSHIVYEAGGYLRSMDLNGGSPEMLDISINPDLPQLRPQWKDAARTITWSDISRSGKRALLTARGEVFSVPLKEGAARNLSSTGGQREYTALWSPDGQKLAWITEHEGGQAVVIARQNGTVEKTLPLGPHFYFLSNWAGGEQPRLVYTDNHLGLFAIDIESGETTRLATEARRDQVMTSVSPDGRWLAYTLEQPNYYRDLMLHDFNTGRNTRVSDGQADVASPAFSPDGKYLYFQASTNSGNTQVGLNMTSQERPYRAAVYAAVLSSEGESPLLEDTGDEEKESAGDEEKKEDKKDKEKEAPKPTRIDLEGLSQRVVAMPLPEQNYGGMEVGSDGDLFYVINVQPGVNVMPPGERASRDNRLMRFDFEEKKEKELMRGVNFFRLSADGSHLILAKDDGSLATAEVADELKTEPLDLGGVRVRVNPQEEWAQIFDEAWRMQKEYFYAGNLHNIDWDAVYEKYQPMVSHAGRREDLNEVIVEMIAEMYVGHNRAGGGDVYRDPEVKTGLLGANIEIVNGRHRLTRVYDGESWNPFVHAPLAVPGNSAQAGEYILAVNGHELGENDNIYAHLQGKIGQQLSLRVGPNANGKGARDIVIEPIEDEYQLRLWSWIEANRQRVSEATDGRVGYIYLPNTAGAGYTFFNRMFFPQLDKEALIIDERSNAGGQAANYIIEVLSRKHLSGWADRDGLIFNTPAGAMHGPKLMLIDQDAGSGGDYLPWAFRLAGIGTLMGTRTWGGLIGIATNPQMMDGGGHVVPFFRFFDPEGNWSVENEGVAPDMEVRLDPLATNRGVDSQLEAGIKEILSQLEGWDTGVMQRAPALPTQAGE